jgi:hypothetical protein
MRTYVRAFTCPPAGGVMVGINVINTLGKAAAQGGPAGAAPAAAGGGRR